MNRFDRIVKASYDAINLNLREGTFVAKENDKVVMKAYIYQNKIRFEGDIPEESIQPLIDWLKYLQAE